MKISHETTKAFLTLFEALPEEIQLEIGSAINKLLHSAHPPTEKRRLDLSGLHSATWEDAGRTYNREELYEDDRV